MFVFFFKQKTAYEMRISDWSSDVCSSDLTHACFAIQRHAANPVLSCRAAGLSVRPSPDRAAGGLGGARQRPDVHAGAADWGGAGNGDHDGWRHGTGHARDPATAPARCSLSPDLCRIYFTHCRHAPPEKAPVGKEGVK